MEESTALFENIKMSTLLDQQGKENLKSYLELLRTFAEENKIKLDQALSLVVATNLESISDRLEELSANTDRLCNITASDKPNA